MQFRSLVLLFAFIFLADSAFSQSSAALKRRKAALNKEIESLKKTRSKIDKSKKLSLSQINMLNAQIRLREDKIGTINSEIRLLDDQIFDNTREVRSLQSQLNILKQQYVRMIRFAQRNQSAYSKLMFIFAARDFNQAYKRLKYLQEFAAYRRRNAVQIRKTQNNLNTEIRILDKNKQEKNLLLKDQEKEKQTLGNEKNTQTQILSKLSKEEKQVKQQLDKKIREDRALARAIQTAIRKEIEAERKRAAAAEAKRLAAARAKAKAAAAKSRAGSATAGKTGVAKAKPVAKGAEILSSSPENLKISAGFLANRGRLPSPVDNATITQHYGARKYGNVTVYNDGIHLKGKPGTAVKSVFSGEVIKVISLFNSYTVMLRHGEYFSVYSGLKNPAVSAGQKVSVKQTLGTIATNAEGTTELQFQIWKGGSPINPSSWIAR
ncbi:MAG TPA: peptidoglycan DD-metalloendopeptidase family protein [Sphingobacteriaceae bacterium]